ncbi:ERMES complex subunit, membrane tether and lipid transfer protein Mmm1 [Schizosaccharomyces pombe]|uniref:Maintenance of mitochondrial morphology protein 1 n=1 Tax=Schizosaccharomyces pombe (strain 972 / ATCC 24843) TaxID=284812 RepID=MMM1_SCHPO|nr:putative Mdm10/Mdm12/Mmm1 complex subunit Mmm1 [Schizosaccharomyces pombe]O74368.3 RecName: Full=Maintenance of mitochondrial morphology protein 1 [Schizosaccharomyces pombe 972h-]CAA20322.3 Mdm10/Mdm12/Mmm1 complex subunit Mmm1 (predicted) [Schizosaccharomyces pombe]|eukprot:NP_595534.3 putative Mdm10/Mdm12/Mmm1 complex subunit Mmm1 [Schizosaccharomyces pombe]
MIHLPQGSFTQGLIVGQLLTLAIIYVFLRFFLFCSPIPKSVANSPKQTGNETPDETPSTPLSNNKKRYKKPLTILEPHILNLLYDVNEHEPESLDWFNVLIAQALIQFRYDACSNDVALRKLETVLNKGAQDKSMVDHIYVRDLSLGDGFPVFSHCRVLPHQHNSSQLRAEMLVSLTDNINCTVDTKLLLNFPKPAFATLPLSITVRICKFVGKIMIYFSPSNGAGQPAYMNLSFDPNFVISLQVSSLVGARSKLQDIPKITQLIESRIRQWFTNRCVSPQFQQIAIPNLWPTSAKEGHARSHAPQEESSNED